MTEAAAADEEEIMTHKPLNKYYKEDSQWKITLHGTDYKHK